MNFCHQCLFIYSFYRHHHHEDGDGVEDDDVGFDEVVAQLLVNEKTRHRYIGRVGNCCQDLFDGFH